MSSNTNKASQARTELLKILDAPDKLTEVENILLGSREMNEDMIKVFEKLSEHKIQVSDLGGYRENIDKN